MAIGQGIPPRLFAFQIGAEVVLLLLRNGYVDLAMVGDHGCRHGRSLARCTDVGGTATTDFGELVGSLEVAASVAGLLEEESFWSGLFHVKPRFLSLMHAMHVVVRDPYDARRNLVNGLGTRQTLQILCSSSFDSSYTAPCGSSSSAGVQTVPVSRVISARCALT
jgi:hypothetical protein